MTHELAEKNLNLLLMRLAMYLQNTWVVYGQVMEVILPKVMLPRIWAMSPEIKIKLPDFFYHL